MDMAYDFSTYDPTREEGPGLKPEQGGNTYQTNSRHVPGHRKVPQTPFQLGPLPHVQWTHNLLQINKTARENRTMAIKLARFEIQKAGTINITAFREVPSCRRLVVYFTSLSVSRLHVQRQVVGWLVNDELERICKESEVFAWMDWRKPRKFQSR